MYKTKNTLRSYFVLLPINAVRYQSLSDEGPSNILYDVYKSRLQSLISLRAPVNYSNTGRRTLQDALGSAICRAPTVN